MDQSGAESRLCKDIGRRESYVDLSHVMLSTILDVPGDAYSTADGSEWQEL